MTSLMYKEALETADVLARQWKLNQTLRAEICQRISEFDPYSFLTVARGSSDHAAQYFNYLASLELGLITTSLTPSLLSLHEVKLRVDKTVSVAISQSGKSPDLINSIKELKNQKSLSLALVNDADSPLAKLCERYYPLHAGAEQSVAATKSYLATLFASASLLATSAKNKELLSALEHLPETLTKQSQPRWLPMIESLAKAKRVMVVGRGLGFAAALEAALKLKETCHIQAEAFSAAEIKHGPQAVIEEGYPLIIFALRGKTQKSLIDLGHEMKERGANVLLIAPNLSPFPYETPAHESLDALCAVHEFYLMVESLSRHLGLDPDRPRSLSKVTLTL